MRPLILISNDDGIAAPGIHYLADCVASMADVCIVAPETPQSGKSSALTVNDALKIMPISMDNPARRAFTVSGTPVDCVKVALRHIVDRQPSLVLAGINHGSNAGVNLIYSGTMGAVMEACNEGFSAIGYSLLSHAMDADFSHCRALIEQITAGVLANPLPKGICLNVNFPKQCTIEGLKVVRSARSHWTEDYERYTSPHGQPFFWLAGKLINEEPEATDTDLYWLDRKYATVVPVRPDQSAVDAITAVSNIISK